MNLGPARFRTILYLGFFFLLAIGVASYLRGGAAEKEEKKIPPLKTVVWSGKQGQNWKDYDRLVQEQKYEKASKLVGQFLEDAKNTKNSKEWVRALIRHVQLRTALHGYEKSVRYLREQEWPKDLLGNTVLHLFYAHTLTHYAQIYGWEIRQRERIESKGTVDLKAWTHDQIFAEAHRAYAEVWKHREQLSEYTVKHLTEYVQPNNYPERIRSTLRDAVTYLWVGLLSDTSGWRPEQQNAVYQLDLSRLLRKGKPEQKINLSDPNDHPLSKINVLLGDLGEWHEKRGNVEASFEAQRVWLEHLHRHFTQERDRLRIRAALRNQLPDLRDWRWWAMGVATLADFIRQEATPDHLVRARKIAEEGQRAYPESVGGKKCLHIVKTIEFPEYKLEGMASDAPRKRSIAVSYKNLTKLYFRAYAVHLKRQIETSDDYNLFPDSRELNEYVKDRKPSHQWAIDLEKTIDFKVHKAFAIPPISDPGFYVVVASGDENFRKKNNVMRALNMVIGDLVLLTRQKPSEVWVEMLSGSTGRPVKGVEVFLYKYDYRQRHRAVEKKTTGADGMVHFEKSQDKQKNYFLFATKGKEVAIDPNHLYMQPGGKRGATVSALIYTDRSIYRPLQTIHFKAVVYRGDGRPGNFRPATKQRLTVSLMDANRQVVESRDLTTNRFGTAAGEFSVPSGRLLGQWSLQSFPGGISQIRVEEYKRPTFEAKLLDSRSPLRLNRPATLKGEVKYYFGLPLSSGQVRWRVTRQPVYPWWWGYCWRWGRGVTSAQETIDAGSGKLHEDGTFTIRFTPEADEQLAKTSKAVTFRYRVTADVTDEGGETRSATRSFRLGFVAVEAAVEMERNFFLAGQPARLTVRRTNLDGVAAPGKGRYRIVKLNAPAKTLLPVDQPFLELEGGKKQKALLVTSGDRKRARWAHGYNVKAILRSWKDGPVQAKGRLKHDENGQGQIGLSSLEAGVYRLYYTTKDSFGGTYEMSREFVVAGKGSRLPLPAYLRMEKNNVRVGETARIYVGTGWSGQLAFLDIYQDGRRTERRTLEGGASETLIEIPLTEAKRGGFGVVLTVLRDHQFVQLRKTLFVPWDNKELEISFSTFRDRLRPGEKEKWVATIKGPVRGSVPIQAAEVLAYMYDRSLDAFVGHHPPSVLAIFPNRTQTVWARSSLGQARMMYVQSHGFRHPPPAPYLREDAPIFLSGYGIGGPGRRGRFRYGLDYDRMDGPGASLRSVSEASIEAEGFARKSGVGGLARSGPADIGRVKKEKKDSKARPQTPQPSPKGVELRSDFSETAFWKPHLLTGPDGSVSIEFTVPDSVTSWNVWVHAITNDLQSGSLNQEAKTIKELMVRPYLPRFLREGDQAELKVVVNNASKRTLKGEVTFDIIDPETEKSLLSSFGLSRKNARARPFEVKSKGGVTLLFPIKTPAKVGLIAVRVMARSGKMSDGELRPIPVLPGRMHLAQSRFVTLKDRARRELKFKDLAKSDDPTRIDEKMVVTVDGQLFYSVLSALPYLVNYPYECTEQMLNRFLSTGILSSLYKQYPPIARMVKKFAKRKTRFETWDDVDPNRKLLLEETPWLRQARGGTEGADKLFNVLDPRIARAEREASLRKLKKIQTSSGAFPWFPGGPPSPYMTLYLLHGFSKGLEFGVAVPKKVIQSAWKYMHRHYIDEVVENMMKHDCCWEFITFLNYTLSNYPDTSWTGGVFNDKERKTMLDFSFRHWKRHSPYLKGYLALTLSRMRRPKDAVLVWESVMDSARTEPDQGTFWAPEDRAWLWYNDTIETHAFAVRTLLELKPQSKQLEGLVLWIFLNKKLNHWKSTRATAEVIYSLAHYLKKTAQLAVREEVHIKAGDLQKTFVFLPDEYTGKKNQIVIPGEKIDPKKHSVIVAEKKTKGHAFVSATWHFSTEKLPKEARSDFLRLTRKYFKRIKTGREVVLKPLKEGAKIAAGDEVEVHLSLTAKHPMEYIHLRDPRPAGFEPVSTASKHKWNLGLYWYEEIRDSGTNFFLERLPQGNYPFKYRLRAAVAGIFKAAPATAQPMYAPEFNAYSSGTTLTIASGR